MNHEEQQQHKFEQKVRIIGGIITVLGVAATTVMQIMNVEKQARTKPRRVKGKVVKTKLLKGRAAKPKKLARMPGTFKRLDKMPMAELRKLKHTADDALKEAKSLVAEIQAEAKEKKNE